MAAIAIDGPGWGQTARRKTQTTKPPAGKAVKDIRRRTRERHSADEKIRIVLEGLRGEESIEALRR